MRRTFTIRIPGLFPLVIERWSLLFCVLGSVVMPFFVIPSALCTVAHELGHAAAALAAGVKVLSVELRAGHGLCVHEQVEDPRKELRIALAGPIVHLLFAVLLAIGLETVRLTGVDGAGSRSLDTVLFLAARFTVVVEPLRALLNLAPALFFDGRSAFTSDGYAVRRAWSALRAREREVEPETTGRNGVLVAEHFQRREFVAASEWARRIATGLGEGVQVGRALTGSGTTVVRLRLRRGRWGGAACDIVVRDERTVWPSDVPLLQIRVTPWSPMHEPLVWILGGSFAAAACVGIVRSAESQRAVFALLGAGLTFAAAALIAQRSRVGVDVTRCAEPVRTLTEAAQRAVAAE